MAVWSIPTLHDVRATRRIDSEFFRPDYVAAEGVVRASKTDDLGKLGGFVPGPFGSAFHVQNYDYKSPYRYIRGRDVKPFFLLKDDNRYIPESDFNRLKQYEVHNDDLMISVVGTLGNVAVCTEKDTLAMFSCKSTLLRVWRADPYFLLSYLNSTPGQLCLLRRQRGAIQTGLNIEDLRTIPVPRFKAATEDEIAASVRTAHRNLLAARDAYHSAQQLLDSELGLDKLTFEKPTGYTAQFSEVRSSLRADPEYFNPVAAALVERITSFDHVRLGASFSVGNGFPWQSKRFLDDNSGEPVVRIRNIRPSHIDIDDLTSIEPNYAERVGFSKARKGDLVVGMDGLKYFFASILEGDCYVNQRVAHLVQKAHAKISPEYATFVVNSRIGQAQLLRDMTIATTVGHITNRNIASLVLPYVSDAFHEKITSLVRSSIDKQQESRQLLEIAKNRVEQIIKEAVQS